MNILLQAATAYSKGELEYAAYLSDQVCFLLGGCYESCVAYKFEM